jgi:hypothetical protein
VLPILPMQRREVTLVPRFLIAIYWAMAIADGIRIAMLYSKSEMVTDSSNCWIAIRNQDLPPECHGRDFFSIASIFCVISFISSHRGGTMR